ncbi:MAG TPA: hypothetical protein VIF02_11115, partial [Methylocella sp.]
MDSEIALPDKGSPEISRIALIRAPKMAVGNFWKISRAAWSSAERASLASRAASRSAARTSR